MVESIFTIIVPVYNGESYVEPFLQHFPAEYFPDLVFINDGSTDRTMELLSSAGKGYTVISHDRNYGKGKALLTGIDHALSRGKTTIVTLDIDLQHQPELIPEFTTCSRHEIRLGYRKNRKGMPIHRQISNFLTSLLLTIRSNHVIKDSQCGYRSFPAQVRDDFPLWERGFQLESEILIRGCLLGYRITHIEIPTIYNREPSGMHPLRDTLKFIYLWFRSFLWT